MRFNNDVFKIKKIGEIFELITGGTPSTKNKMYWNGDVPWMPSGDINKKYIYSVSKSISIDGYENSSTKYIPIHSVLIALAGQGKTRGTSAILEIETCINQSIAAILPRKDFDPYYIFHFMESKYDNLRLISSGDGGRGGLNKKLISNYLFSYPSFTTQQKIAIFLNKIDQRIQTQSKIIDDLKYQKKYITDHLLSELNKKKLIQLSEILEEYTEKTSSNNEYPVLSSTASGIFLQSEYFSKDASSADTTGYRIIPRGYCTYRSMSDTGHFTFNQQNIIDVGIISPAYPVFYSERYMNEFIILYLNNSKNIKKQILELKTGGTRFALSFKTLINFKIPEIDIETQNKILKIINSVSVKIDNEKKIYSLLTKEKTYLLNNMFI